MIRNREAAFKEMESIGYLVEFILADLEVAATSADIQNALSPLRDVSRKLREVEDYAAWVEDWITAPE